MCDDPSLRQSGEGVQLASLGDLHSSAEVFSKRIGERLAGVAAIDTHTGDSAEAVGAVVQGGQAS